MIPVCIFTYSKDAPVLEQCVLSLKDHGFDRIYICEQHNAPLPDETVRRVKCNVESSMFNRGGNLNGRDAVLGISQFYLSVMRRTSAHYVMKIDSDFMIADPQRIKQAVEDEVIHACPLTNTDDLTSFGGLQIISKPLALLMYQLALHNQLPCPQEDIAARMIAEAMIGEARSLDSYPKGNFCAGYRYREAKCSIKEYSEMFDTVTFGNYRLIDAKPELKRELAAKAMEEYRACYLAKVV